MGGDRFQLNLETTLIGKKDVNLSDVPKPPKTNPEQLMSIPQRPNRRQLADSAEIVRALWIYHRPDSDDCFEIRALHVLRRGTVSGVSHVSEIAQAAKAAASLSGRAEAVYFTPNAITAEIRARAPGYLV